MCLVCATFTAQSCAFPNGRDDPEHSVKRASPKPFPPTEDLTCDHQKQINTHLIELPVNTQDKGQDIQNFNANSTTTFIPKMERVNSRWIK